MRDADVTTVEDLLDFLKSYDSVYKYQILSKRVVNGVHHIWSIAIVDGDTYKMFFMWIQLFSESSLTFQEFLEKSNDTQM